MLHTHGQTKSFLLDSLTDMRQIARSQEKLARKENLMANHLSFVTCEGEHILRAAEPAALRILREFPQLWSSVDIRTNRDTAIYTFHILVFDSRRITRRPLTGHQMLRKLGSTEQRVDSLNRELKITAEEVSKYD